MRLATDHLAVALATVALLSCDRPVPPSIGALDGPTDSGHVHLPDTSGPRTITGVKGSALVFSDGSTFETGLKHLTYVGSVDRGDGRTHVLLLADRDVDSLTEKALYIIDPQDTVPPKADREHSWNAPGRKLDGETGEPFLTTEVYYGMVLPDTMGVIWYETAVMPDGQRKLNTTLLCDGPTGLDTLVFFGQGRLAATNTLAYRGKCQGLKGTDERQAP